MDEEDEYAEDGRPLLLSLSRTVGEEVSRFDGDLIGFDPSASSFSAESVRQHKDHVRVPLKDNG